MLKIEYTHTDYSDLLKHYAKFLNGKLEGNVLQMDPSNGKGFFKLIKLPNGLQCLLSDFTVNEDVFFQRKKNDQDFYTLRFDEILVPAGENGVENKSAVFLASTRFDMISLLTKGTSVKSINILFSKEWIEQFLDCEEAGNIIKKYLSLKMSSYNYEPMDAEYKRILQEIIRAEKDKNFENLVVYNRVMLLIERFFTRVYKKMDDLHFEMKISNDDIKRLQMVEQELLKDFTIPPPGISSLARMAAMSPSKLKNSFKEIYGLPVYQYFQKHRMNKAKAMLLSNKYSVKEVGMEVGYSNLSNFAKAFKKSFDQLPSDIINGR